MSGKILIADDLSTNRIGLKGKLAEACYRSLLASDGDGCLRLARSEMPDAILLDRSLRDIPGVEVLRRLRADPATRDIPVILLSTDDRAETRIEALRAGADDFMAKPVDGLMLLARLRNLLRARGTASDLAAQGGTLEVLGLAEAAPPFEGPGLVALVTERPEEALALRRGLAGLLHDRVEILAREAALAAGTVPQDAAPDIFVIAADTGGPGGGLRLMSELRSRPASRHAAFCVVGLDDRPDGAAMAFDLGAGDVLPAAPEPGELALRLRKLLRRKRAADRMRASIEDGLRLALVDPLTGLHNRRYAMPHLAGISDRAGLAGLGYAVMVVDLDRFKAVNDRWGHAAGDAVLVEVARRLADNLRSGDLLARIGGEEFLVGLPDTGPAAARAIADRLCEVVQARPIRLPAGRSLHVTCSIGLAVSEPREGMAGEPVAAVLDRADRALRLAKAGGRNQVTLGRSAA